MAITLFYLSQLYKPTKNHPFQFRILTLKWTCFACFFIFCHLSFLYKNDSRSSFINQDFKGASILYREKLYLILKTVWYLFCSDFRWYNWETRLLTAGHFWGTLPTSISHTKNWYLPSILYDIGSSKALRDLITSVKSLLKYHDLVYCFINYFFPAQWVIIYYNWMTQQIIPHSYSILLLSYIDTPYFNIIFKNMYV